MIMCHGRSMYRRAIHRFVEPHLMAIVIGPQAISCESLSKSRVARSVKRMGQRAGFWLAGQVRTQAMVLRKGISLWASSPPKSDSQKQPLPHGASPLPQARRHQS